MPKLRVPPRSPAKQCDDDLKLEQVPMRILSMLETLAGSRELVDDVTLVVVEVH